MNPYEGEIKNEEELIKLIHDFNNQINNETNKTTGIPPVVLMKQEREHLHPIPNKVLLNSYIKDIFVQVVPETLLINYKGCGYSVDKKLIGKRVKVVPIDNKLYIYFNTKLECIHDITHKKFNYTEKHIRDALGLSMENSTDDEIEKRALENLSLLEKIGE